MLSKTFENNNAHLSKFYQYTQKSTIFDAAYEQAYISSKKCKKNFSPTNLHRNPISMRNSQTFYSTIFTPIENIPTKINPHKPKDNLSSDYFGRDTNEYIRKSIVSDFHPNFKPNFKNVNTWKINIYGESETPLPKQYINEIKPIRNKASINFRINSHQGINKNRVESPSSIKTFTSFTRSSTPQNQKFSETLRTGRCNDSAKNITDSFNSRQTLIEKNENKIFFGQNFKKNRIGRSICHKLKNDDQICDTNTWNKVDLRSLSQGYMNETICSSKKKIIVSFN